jgi:hypothetical protein
MKKSTSLCFSATGLINTESLAFLQNKDVDTVVIFGDGSEEAFDQVKEFDYDQLFHTTSVTKVAIGRTPLYDLRAIHPDGSLSKPHYVGNNDLKTRWICANVCAPYLALSISDITSQSDTQVELDLRQTELMCYASYKLWQLMRQVEEELCFPAAVINRLITFTYSLKPNTIDIPQLRQQSGLSTLEYNPNTDLLAITVADDIFQVKLNLLDEFYGRYILPLFNEINGRRMRIRVSIKGTTGKFSEPVDSSYGELGRIVEEMMSSTRETMITPDCPMENDDLLAFAKKVKVNDESCIWLAKDKPVPEEIDRYRDALVHIG